MASLRATLASGTLILASVALRTGGATVGGASFAGLAFSANSVGQAESLSGFEGAAHVVIARMVTAIARTIPKINSSPEVHLARGF
jgi:hypothetical protein